MSRIGRLLLMMFAGACLAGLAEAERPQGGEVENGEPASRKLRSQLNRAFSEMALAEPVPYSVYKEKLAHGLRGLADEVEEKTTDLLGQPEPAFAFCLPLRYGILSNALCLNGRFLAVAAADNPFDPAGQFPAGTMHLTPSSGYFYFLDPFNPEVVIKEINACFIANPSSHWIFAAGLTNFGVEIGVQDLATGVVRVYRNNPGTTFVTIIDQQPPFPCP